MSICQKEILTRCSASSHLPMTSSVQTDHSDMRASQGIVAGVCQLEEPFWLPGYTPALGNGFYLFNLCQCLDIVFVETATTVDASGMHARLIDGPCTQYHGNPIIICHPSPSFLSSYPYHTMSSTRLTPDLSLPSHLPEIRTYLDKNWDDASFALYTLTELPDTDLDSISSLLNKKWMENQGNEGHLLVQISSVHNFTGESLTDVVHAHAQMDKRRSLVRMK